MSYRKSIDGATKVKLAPPKAKYVEHIVSATRTGEAGVGEVFRLLSPRIRDSTWTITFKALIVVHLMIREGEPNITLAYLSTSPRQFLSVDEYAEVQTQGRNIRHYSTYLMYRAKSYQKAKTDYVRAGQGRMRKLTVDKGLLRETEAVQEQIAALIKCDLVTEEPENDITLCALRLLVQDLLALFPVMNEGVINVLEHFFELSKPDAERALSIYKRFAVQTDMVVRYLTVAKRFSSSTRLDIPKLEHAKLSLASSLEEYLNDADFDTSRRQYLAEREAKRSGKPLQRAATESLPASSSTNRAAASAPTATTKKPPADLMDFFDSIEPPQPTQQAAPAGYIQQTGFQPQAMPNQHPMQFPQFANPGTNPFGQLQPQPTGAGFGGYGPQSYSDPAQSNGPPQQFPMATGYNHQQSNSISSQATNPFRQSGGQMPDASQAGNAMHNMTTSPQPFGQQPMMAQPAGSNPFAQQMPQPMISQQTGYNPFGAPAQQIPQMPTAQDPFSPFGPQHSAPPPMLPTQTGSNPFAQQPQTQSYPPQAQQMPQQNYQPQSQPQPLLPQATGTNPFARAPDPSSQPPQAQNGGFGALVSQATGSTNPFKSSAFVNQQTGQGWQNAPQSTMGGLEQLPTTQVFPRPGQAQQQPQQWY